MGELKMDKVTELTDELRAQRWPSHSAAISWLKRRGTSADKLGCIIGMADDNGMCLQPVADPEVAKDVLLDEAAGRVPAKKVKAKIEAETKAREAVKVEEAGPQPDRTIIDAVAPLPSDQLLVGRKQDGSPMADWPSEAYIRFPVAGPADKLKFWAAYYCASMHTVIDVVSVEGELIERFDGRQAARPKHERPDLPTASGAPKRRSAPRANGAQGGALNELAQKCVELAAREQGAPQDELNALSGDKGRNWVSLLSSWGRKAGYDRAVSDRQRPPTYKLVK
jgi:hypothetical protein